MKVMSIDFVRQIIEQTLFEQHNVNPNYFGGKDQVNLFSFYEQLQEDYEVDRYRELYDDLVKQQNRSDIIMNGTIIAPENPQMMNLNSVTIIPMVFTCAFFVKLKDRDQAIETLDNLFKKLRGRKRDIACFENGKLMYVGTIANDVLGTPTLKSGDYIGDYNYTINGQDIEEKMFELESKGIVCDLNVGDYIYYSHQNKMEAMVRTYKYIELDNIEIVSFDNEQEGNKMTVSGTMSFSSYSSGYSAIPTYMYNGFFAYITFYDGVKTIIKKVKVNVAQGDVSLNAQGVINGTGTFSQEFNDNDLDWDNLSVDCDEIESNYQKVENNGEYAGIIVPPVDLTFEKYKVSLSFDTIKIDEPRVLDAEECCTISFGGSATLVDEKAALGNDLTKVGIAKYKIKADTDVTLDNTYHWLEPLEMPNDLGISSELSQLASHNFIQNKHNDGINPTFDYSFVLDKSEILIKQWWKYARYGIQGTPTASTPYSDGVTPNTLYKIKEIWSSWGEVEIYDFVAKATENIDIENTESDALTVKLRFELQKE